MLFRSVRVWTLEEPSLQPSGYPERSKSESRTTLARYGEEHFRDSSTTSATNPWSRADSHPARPVCSFASGCPAAGECSSSPSALTPSRGFRVAFDLVQVAPAEIVSAGCSSPSSTRGPCTRLLAEGATPSQVRLSRSSVLRWMFSLSTDSRRRMARGSRTGRNFGSLVFAVTTLALGSPWPSRSLCRARSNRLGFGRLPSCASVCCIVQPTVQSTPRIAPWP